MRKEATTTPANVRRSQQQGERVGQANYRVLLKRASAWHAAKTLARAPDTPEEWREQARGFLENYSNCVQGVVDSRIDPLQASGFRLDEESREQVKQHLNAIWVIFQGARIEFDDETRQAGLCSLLAILSDEAAAYREARKLLDGRR
jgi:hypothetical protein